MPKTGKKIIIREAVEGDLESIKTLIDYYAEREILLPRTIQNIKRHADDFIVALSGSEVVGTGALFKYGTHLAEVRSLAVRHDLRRMGIGKLLAGRLVQIGYDDSIDKIFVMTVVPGFFKKLGFTRVEHESLPDKVWKDCIHCQHHNKCNETAMIFTKETNHGR